MNPTSQAHIIETDAVLDRARLLWHRASESAGAGRVELYAKVATRVRSERAVSTGRPITRRTHESGIAVRTLITTEGGAGFAAASGVSPEVASWVVGRALRSGERVGADSPELAGIKVEGERADLDEGEGWPDAERVAAAPESLRGQRWIEAATTVEVLCGAGGWFTVRRRHRVWGMTAAAPGRLWARRGFAHLPDPFEARTRRVAPSKMVHEGTRRTVLLLPEAVAPIASALAVAFHTRPASSNLVGGPGWTIEDAPDDPLALAGGRFDDAGFPAMTRSLAEAGRWLRPIEGPGAFWRRSFREPPNATAISLRMPGGDRPDTDHEAVALASRVIPLGGGIWVIELEFVPHPNAVNGERAVGYLRTTPEALLSHLGARLGDPVATADGPIVPSVLLEIPPPPLG